jgi:hypothetical protein
MLQSVLITIGVLIFYLFTVYRRNEKKEKILFLLLTGILTVFVYSGEAGRALFADTLPYYNSYLNATSKSFSFTACCGC